MFIRVEGLHCANMLEEVNLPTDNAQYKKLGEGFLDEEVVNDSVFDWFEQYIYLRIVLRPWLIGIGNT